MKKLVFCLTLAAAMASAVAHAQVSIDMSRVTCAQYLAMPPAQAADFSAWMSGYFSASRNLDTLDFRYVERNRRVVGNYCKTHKSETVMSAMQKNWR